MGSLSQPREAVAVVAAAAAVAVVEAVAVAEVAEVVVVAVEAVATRVSSDEEAVAQSYHWSVY